MPAPAELVRHLRVGTREQVAGARSRSHLGDGRAVGWYGAPGTVIDAELARDPVPSALASRYGPVDFWVRWTRAECAAKLACVPLPMWLREHGLAEPADIELHTIRLGDTIVSIGRRSL
ncbi:MAG: hypothetical protein M3Z50_00660 [Actinomycetota bacterium]|nr:hypothetical protein [Actinomycetota bacterium]